MQTHIKVKTKKVGVFSQISFLEILLIKLLKKKEIAKSNSGVNMKYLKVYLRRHTLLLFAILIAPDFFSGNLDSLENALKNARSDSAKVQLLNMIGDNLLHSDPERMYLKAHEALALAKKANLKRGMGQTYQLLGVYFNFNEGDSALFYLDKSKLIFTEIEDKPSLASVYTSLGTYHEIKNSFGPAMDNYLKGLTIFEIIKSDKGMAGACMGLGNVFFNLSNYNKAIEYSQKSFNYYTKIKSPYAAWAMNNMANAYEKMGNLEKAIELYDESLRLKLHASDFYGAIFSIDNLGTLCLKRGEFKKAITYYEKGLNICRKKNLEKETFANSFQHLSRAYLEIKNYSQAKMNLDSMYLYSSKLNISEIKLNYILLKSNYHKEVGDYKTACDLKDDYIAAKDSAVSGEVSKIVSEADAKFKTEKKQKEIELLNKDRKIDALLLRDNQNKLTKQRNIIATALGLAVLLGVLVFLLYSRNKLKQKTNEKLESFNQQITVQKNMLEEKRREIIDSITYAKRLQEAILPPKEFVTEHLVDNFILYKPKDLVAGDFYWAESVGNKFLIAAADSTGHGVPGAMVSVVCSNALNRSLKEFGLTEPGQLLDKTRELVLDTFSKSSSEVKDGMDISLLCIEKSASTIKIKWAGANNPLWYLLPDSQTLSEKKGNKQPIGKTEKPTPFTTNEIEFVSGTTFYLFTDGYADQFGGPKGKKFKYKQLEELLFSIHHLPMAEQMQILNNRFKEWRGNLEQVDDVCIIGIRL